MVRFTWALTASCGGLPRVGKTITFIYSAFSLQQEHRTSIARLTRAGPAYLVQPGTYHIPSFCDLVLLSAHASTLGTIWLWHSILVREPFAFESNTSCNRDFRRERQANGCRKGSAVFESPEKGSDSTGGRGSPSTLNVTRARDRFGCSKFDAKAFIQECRRWYRFENRHMPARHLPGRSQTSTTTTPTLLLHYFTWPDAASFCDRCDRDLLRPYGLSHLPVSFVPLLFFLSGLALFVYWTGSVRIHLDPHGSSKRNIPSDTESVSSVIWVTLYPGAWLRILRGAHGGLASHRDPRNAHLPL
ncbi:hypothetical protein DFH94DRAFT_812870 [Russula ochroleuca]|uniref:Uncharacterized protein n=1 Tax=Russula ochroleuca TaxID=152965 RepID=A0A9P5N1Q2_9AGAM|nr:hypothetical protein DFH94DRAFT_812870 [Russula ochroleuca]